MQGSEDERSDLLAQRAARLVFDGARPDLPSALHHLGAPRRLSGLARRHLEAMQASLSEVGVDPRVEPLGTALDILEVLEDLEWRLADDGWIHRGSLLVGRILTDLHASSDVIHIRHHGDRPMVDLELELARLEIRESNVRSLMTRHGRITTLEFELDGHDFRLLRCPPNQVPLGSPNLVSGAALASMDRIGLSRHVEQLNDG